MKTAPGELNRKDAKNAKRAARESTRSAPNIVYTEKLPFIAHPVLAMGPDAPAGVRGHGGVFFLAGEEAKDFGMALTVKVGAAGVHDHARVSGP